MIKEAFDTFGKHSFQHAIFYSNQKCLRFELSAAAKYDSRISMLDAARQRAAQVINTVFSKSEYASICLAFAGDSFLSNLSQFKELQKLEVEIPTERFTFREWNEEDEWHRNYLAFKVPIAELHQWLFGKLANELGIRPSFWFDIYIFDIDLGVLVHPYDDRGMDIVGTNTFMISRLYKEFNDWLLGYDIEIMQQWFG